MKAICAPGVELFRGGHAVHRPPRRQM